LSALLTSQLAREQNLSLDAAYESLMGLAPSETQRRLEEGLGRYSLDATLPQELEHLQAEGAAHLDWRDDLGLGGLDRPSGGWLAWRQDTGVIDRRPDNFYSSTFALFRHARGVVIGDRLDRRNHVESGPVLSDMTPGEPAFAHLIEHLLNKAQAPEYRQLTVEALNALSSFFKQNPGLTINDALCLDSTIGHAVRIHYLASHPEHVAEYDQHKALAWRHFYESAPSQTSKAMVEALLHLLSPGEESSSPVASPALTGARG
jgi:phosphorylase kinase alpha/beta subunit